MNTFRKGEKSIAFLASMLEGLAELAPELKRAGGIDNLIGEREIALDALKGEIAQLDTVKAQALAEVDDLRRAGEAEVQAIVKDAEIIKDAAAAIRIEAEKELAAARIEGESIVERATNRGAAELARAREQLAGVNREISAAVEKRDQLVAEADDARQRRDRLQGEIDRIVATSQGRG